MPETSRNHARFTGRAQSYTKRWLGSCRVGRLLISCRNHVHLRFTTDESNARLNRFQKRRESPRPDDPLWNARREAASEAGLSAFAAVDLPRAANLTAQGAGRLIRSMDDRGLIVLCDRRVQTRRYGPIIINTLPEMPIITELEDAVAYLESL